MEAQSHEDWITTAVQRFGRPLTQYAHSLLDDADRARDVVQDTFVRLCSQRRESVESRLAPWLFTVCRNRAMDVLRKERRMTPLTEEHQAVMGTEPPDPTKESASSSIKAALGRLPSAQREVIRLKFLHEMSYREISKVTGLSESHVGVLIHNGIKTLRQHAAFTAPERSLA